MTHHIFKKAVNFVGRGNYFIHKFFQVCLTKRRSFLFLCCSFFFVNAMAAELPENCKQSGGTDDCAPFVVGIKTYNAEYFTDPGICSNCYSLHDTSGEVPSEGDARGFLAGGVAKINALERPCALQLNDTKKAEEDLIPCDGIGPCRRGAMYGSSEMAIYNYFHHDGAMCADLSASNQIVPVHFVTNYQMIQWGGCPIDADRVQKFGDGYLCVKFRKNNVLDVGKNLGCPKSRVGNPCNAATGNKYLREADYLSSSVGALTFVRYYNSFLDGWRNTYASAIRTQSYYSGTPFAFSTATMTRSDGRRFVFTLVNGRYIADPDVNDQLFVTMIDGKANGWTYVTDNDATEMYDVTGKLLSIVGRDGPKQVLEYGATGSNAGLLTKVTDAFGKKLSFAYDAAGRYVSMTDPMGHVTQYGYDSIGNLTRVTYPDGKYRTYHYNEAEYTQGSNLPYALTGITDENNDRFAIYKYDLAGRAISSEHALGSGKVSLNFTQDENGSPVFTDVTDSLGMIRRYDFTIVLGAAKNTGIDSPCQDCGDSARNKTYDDQGNLISSMDYNGNWTTYTYDLNRNLEISRTEGNADALRTITTTWHPDFHLPVMVTESDRITEYQYDVSRGILLSKTITDNRDKSSRRWSYAYDANALLTKIKGPRSDVDESVTFTYDNRGNLSSSTDALGNVTRYTAHDENGKLLTMSDPNGLVTSMSYDVRGRLLKRITGQETTQYVYDDVGQLTKVINPDSSWASYAYDAAHRLTDITDNSGYRIHYTFDTADNRIQEQVYNSNGQLTQTMSRSFDQSNRLAQVAGGSSQVTAYSYDDNGNIIARSEPENREAKYQVDSLNRIVSVTNASNEQIEMAYDPYDQVIKVTDPTKLDVKYSVNSLGDVTATDSSDIDSDNRNQTYDAAGNRVSKTDFRGRVIRYTYDALNRLTKLNVNGGAANSYVYDVGRNAIGRLSSMKDESGTTKWSYTTQGRVASVTRQTGTRTFITRYDYDAAGRLQSITYPSGHLVSYGYDAAQIVAVSVDGKPFLNQVQRHTSGAVSGWTWGNGKSYTRNYDMDARLASYDAGAGLKTLRYDQAGRITQIVDSADSKFNQKFEYDSSDRVVSFQNGEGMRQGYQYDLNGNRTGRTINGVAYPYTYLPQSNALLQVAGPVSETWSAGDPAFNSFTDGSHLFSLDAYRRVHGFSGSSGNVQYVYNGLQQRVSKQYADGSGIHYLYGQQGELLEETSGNSATDTDYVWLGAQPVGIIRNNQMNYIYADHLNTPRQITDSLNQLLWRWESEPFGETEADSNPQGQGSFVFNLRFPGQYFDQESGLNYNWHRYYNPRTGRYIQSDPIGLEGGINTYSYANGNPISLSDPLGLFGWADMPTLNQGFVDAVAGFGDAFAVSKMIRDTYGIGGVNKCSSSYKGGEIAGTVWGLVPMALEGGALFGATKFGNQIVNSNRYFRIGMGRFGGAEVSRISSPYLDNAATNFLNKFIDLGTKGHIDLSSRLIAPPPVGALVNGSDCECK